MKFRYQKLPLRGHDSRKPLIARPLIPIYLHSKEKRTRYSYYALLDSGADSVLMPAELGTEIGIEDITAGKRLPVVGVAGQQADVYYHNAMIEIVGDERKVPLLVGFSDKIYIPLLGRELFRHFNTIAFREEKEEVELKK